MWGGGILDKKTIPEQRESLENLELAIYLNDEKTSTIPSKEGNIFDEIRSSCTNGSYIVWDYESWSPIVKSVTVYPTRCSLYFKTGYKEDLLNGTDPVLKDELVPVTIDNNGTVKKADLGSSWYRYEEKRWANAVVLKNEQEDYLAGETIPEDNIESYFVWIPKYRYQLWDLGNYDSLTSIDTSKVHEIPIIFGDYDASDSKEGECTTPMKSGESGNCKVGDYMTHPAFISIPSTGFWVGKFETGYDGATTKGEAEQNVNDSSKVVIKPNVYSWRGIQVANAFYTSYNYKRNLDSHMMKNTEWGAVAYLQHSKYGSSINVRINNNSNNITGYQANNEPTCGFTNVNEQCNQICGDNSCNTAYPNSVLASTTNNISGIFDMSGGSIEYVMSFMENKEEKILIGLESVNHSGFNGVLSCPTCNGNNSGIVEITSGIDLPKQKYYDLYNYSKSNQFSNRILGDAIGELGPMELISRNTLDKSNYLASSWHSLGIDNLDQNHLIYARGGPYHDGKQVGIFTSQTAYGQLLAGWSFRIILTPV